MKIASPKGFKPTKGRITKKMMEEGERQWAEIVKVIEEFYQQVRPTGKERVFMERGNISRPLKSAIETRRVSNG